MVVDLLIYKMSIRHRAIGFTPFCFTELDFEQRPNLHSP